MPTQVGLKTAVDAALDTLVAELEMERPAPRGRGQLDKLNETKEL